MIKLFKLFGTPLYLSGWWFVFPLIIIPFTGTWDEIRMSLVWLLILEVSVVLHEVGHLLGARRYGVKTKSVEITFFGGAANYDKGYFKLSELQKAWVSFSGPLVNIILLLIGFTGAIMTEGGFDDPWVHFYIVLFLVNALLGVFNLLPIFPMDGGKILENLLIHWKVDGAFYKTIRVSQFLLLGLFALAVFASQYVFGIFIVVMFVTTYISERSQKNADKLFVRLKELIKKDIDSLGTKEEKLAHLDLVASDTFISDSKSEYVNYEYKKIIDDIRRDIESTEG